MKHSRSKNAVLLMIIFICSICSNNVWARETGTMDQLEKENLDDVDKMNLNEKLNSGFGPNARVNSI